MIKGFLRVAACTPSVKVADCVHNAEQIVKMVRGAPEATSLMVFPELCITGYTCEDLFLHTTLIQAAEQAVERILTRTADCNSVFVVGVPVAVNGAIYNCAAVCCRGSLLGLVPKSELPNHGEFYERRWFTPASAESLYSLAYAGQTVDMSRDMVFCCMELPQFRFGIEIGEDLWTVSQPSQRLAANGAVIIANLSASTEGVGRPGYRRHLVSMQSARLTCAYIMAGAGKGESTTDAVFSGHNLIAENGVILAESERFTTGITCSEIDLEHLEFDRRRMTSFRPEKEMCEPLFSLMPEPFTPVRSISPSPFVPSGDSARDSVCEEILEIQSAGLAQRLSATGLKAVIGLSGGLDSSLALLVCVRAYDRLGWPKSDIHAVTMPGFGTTVRTLANARAIAGGCGAALHEIDISRTTSQHLSDIRHDGSHDVTYENAQARERTQVLMDFANMIGGLVVGTGDLSELALGWSTYNGDHMSMYGVNASVPKTLVRYLVAYESKRCGGGLQNALDDVIDTPVSPELLPSQDGQIAQKTEDIVGPYDLHDFFLYHMVRYADGPERIYHMAVKAFSGRFSNEEIKKWLTVFCRRFFAQQFKRSCLPDGPRVGSVALSPRGDWRMPSDAQARLWLDEIEKL